MRKHTKVFWGGLGSDAPSKCEFINITAYYAVCFIDLKPMAKLIDENRNEVNKRANWAVT